MSSYPEMEKLKKKQRARQIIDTVLTLLFMLLIFSFSAQDGETSSATGGRVTVFVQRLFFPSYSEGPQEELEAFLGALNFFIRKAAHYTEYVVLGALLSRTLQSYGLSYRGRILFGILAGGLYAVLDECHQLFVPGRTGAVFDVLIDLFGVIAGVLILTGLSAVHESFLTQKKGGNIIKEKQEAEG